MPSLDRPFPQAPILGVDIETSGLDLWADAVTAIAVSDGDGARVLDVRGLDPAAVGRWLSEQVYDRKVVLHNAIFDLPRLALAFQAGFPQRAFCTRIAETLLTAGLDEPDKPGLPLSRSLQATAQRRLGVELEKEHEVRTGFQRDNLWTPEQIAYAEMDARILVPLRAAQVEELVRQDLVRVARLEMAALRVFAEMVARGVQIDVAGMEPLLVETRRRRDQLQEGLVALLTNHVFWERKRKNAAAEQKLVAWGERYREAEARFRAEWAAQTAQPYPDVPWVWDWSGVTIPGSSKEITNEEVESWYDTTVPKGKSEPAGLTRFVKRMLQHWRTEPGNQRPAVTVVAVEEPINLRSVPQKVAAVQSYYAAYRAENGLDEGDPGADPPLNFRRPTLVGATMDAPEQIRTELLEPLIEYSRLDKIDSSFGQALLDMLSPAQSLHGGWNPCGTATGRPTCTKPNLLNMPKSAVFRSKFVAREGQLFVVADFSQIELRILAELSGDPTMVAVFQEERDLHTQTAADIYEIALADVSEEQRKTAKIVNFGIAYGMAARALRRNLAGWRVHVTLEEAQHYLAMWRKKYRHAARWIEQQGRAGLQPRLTVGARKFGYVTTPLGRRRSFDLSAALLPYEQGKVQREAANFPIQGASADITKLAMVLIQRELTTLGGSIVLQVYDEIVAEVPAEEAALAKEVVSAAMHVAAGSVLRAVPVKVDAVISPSWSEKAGQQWEAQVLGDELEDDEEVA